LLKRKISIFLIFLIGLLAISAASADENVTDVVDIAQDSNLSTTYSVNGNTFDDIQKTINSARDGDTVELSGNYVGSSEITVKKPITIVGKNNAVLDAQDKTRIFHVYSSGVVFKNIKFINANAIYSGGAIFREFGKDFYFDVENCEFISNSANYGTGGAIYGGNAYKCTFINNTCGSNDGGAISNGIARECEFTNNYAGSEGGAAAESIIQNCVFTANHGREGGALFNCDVTDSIFRNNYATYDGGAIYTRFDSDKKYVQNCTFINNTADISGGAIYISIVTGSKFINNTCRKYGGAIYGGTVDNCIFEGNSVIHPNENANGGACSGTDVKNSIFIGNYASNNGGALNDGSVENSKFINNTCGENGGALYNSELKNSTFKNNKAKNGGAIFFDYGHKDIPIENSTFESNTASENGGAVNAKYNEIKNCIFILNNAEGNGGAVESSGNIFDCEFSQNSAKYGGAILTQGYNNCISDSTFTSNKATADGGAIKGTDDHMVSSCIFTKNSANRGGAAYGMKVSYSNFTDNSAKEGPALYGGSADECYFKGDAEKLTYKTSLRNTIIKADLKLSQEGIYYQDKTLRVILKNKDTGNGVSARLILKFSNGKTVLIDTSSNGAAAYDLPFDEGSYSVTASVDSDVIICDSQSLSGITIEKAPIKISASKLTTIYKSGKYFKVKVINSMTNQPMKNIALNLKVYTGKSFKPYGIVTDENGIATFSSSKLAVGSHKVIVSSANGNCIGSEVSSTIKVNKIYPKLSTFTYKTTLGTDLTGKGIAIKDKNTKEAIKGIKVKVTFYTTSKKKTTFNLVTGSNGKCAFFTNKYSVGSHKIIISVNIPSTYKNAVDKKYKAIKKTTTYKLVGSQKFKLMNTNKYFNIIYSNGQTKVTS
jgi:predicted outer membrane repeat protein